MKETPSRGSAKRGRMGSSGNNINILFVVTETFTSPGNHLKSPEQILVLDKSNSHVTMILLSKASTSFNIEHSFLYSCSREISPKKEFPPIAVNGVVYGEYSMNKGVHIHHNCRAIRGISLYFKRAIHSPGIRSLDSLVPICLQTIIQRFIDQEYRACKVEPNG